MNIYEVIYRDCGTPETNNRFGINHTIKCKHVVARTHKEAIKKVLDWDSGIIVLSSEKTGGNNNELTRHN